VYDDVEGYDSLGIQVVCLHPTPYTLHPSPYTLHPTSYTLHSTPCTLHPTPYHLDGEGVLRMEPSTRFGPRSLESFFSLLYYSHA